jgi:hypothetical protein
MENHPVIIGAFDETCLRGDSLPLSDQIGKDQHNPDLPSDPTRWSDANRTESIGRDIQASRREKYPCASRRPVSCHACCVNHEQGRNKLRKYLKQIAMGPHEAARDAAGGSWLVTRTGYPPTAKLAQRQNARNCKLPHRKPDRRDKRPEV